MAGRRRLLVYAIVIAALMTLFPPWLVQESRDRGNTFGPQHASGYGFIGNPPSGYVDEELHALGPPSGRYVVARLDYGRLFFQYVALAAIFGGLALVASPRQSTRDGVIASERANAPWWVRAGADATPSDGAVPRPLHQLTAFLVLWAGHAALTDVDALMHLGELSASDIIALLTEGFIYVFVPWALLAPFIHRLTRGTFKGTGMDGLLLASGAGFVIRVALAVFGL